MKKSVLLGTGILATALLTGCGGSGGGASDSSVAEYDLSAYEDRTVSQSTLAGTWVIAGKGTYNYKDAVDTETTNYSVKEYFIITGDAASGYKKTSCQNEGYLDAITVNGSEMKVNDFTGTITENSRVVGEITSSTNNDSYTESETVNVTLIKIGDSTAPFGTLSGTTPRGALNALPISCFNQTKGTFKYNSYSTSFEEFSFFDGATIEKYSGTGGFTALSHYFYGTTTMFDTDYDGHSVSFSHTVNSSLSETLTFNASTNADSVQGTLTITLP